MMIFACKCAPRGGARAQQGDPEVALLQRRGHSFALGNAFSPRIGGAEPAAGIALDPLQA